jgi:hypothetical protein
VPQPGTRKHRELRFDHHASEHVEEARKLLAGLEGMEIDERHRALQPVDLVRDQRLFAGGTGSRAGAPGLPSRQ